MKLTRRDAVATLIAAGAGTGAVGVAALGSDDRFPGDWREAVQPSDDVETVVAAAEVIYPPEVEGIPAFVGEYVSGLPESDRDGVKAAARLLDGGALERHHRPLADLPPALRDDVLHGMGVHVADSDPEGDAAERIRYHLVNELLYALFTSPKGSRLVGIDNPVGYPGGYGSYRETP